MKDTFQRIFGRDRNAAIVFCLLFIVMCLCYNYQHELFTRPHGHHVWRQTDGFCIVRNYVDVSMNFFQPRISQFISKDGLELAEFPISYYTAAVFCEVFGYHEWIVRLVHLMFVFAGLWCLYRLVAGLLGDHYYGIIISLLLFTSPVLAFYAVTPMPDVAGMSLAICGLYWFYRYFRSGRLSDLSISFVLYTVAGCVKPTSIISLITIGALWLCVAIGLAIRFLKQDPSYRKMLIPTGLYIIATMALVAAWWVHAAHYRVEHHSSYFQMNANPIWEASTKDIKDALVWFDLVNINLYFNKPALIITGILLMISVFLLIRRFRMLLLGYVMFLAGTLCYLLLFFTQLHVHDYYIIVVLPLITATLLLFALAMRYRYPEILLSHTARVVIFIFFIANLSFAAYKVGKINSENWRNGNLSQVTDIEPYLDSIGVKKTDFVIYWGDFAPNAGLYFMNKRGWAKWSMNTLNDERIKQRIAEGAKFMILDLNQFDPDAGERAIMDQYASHKIGERNNVLIYSLTP